MNDTGRYRIQAVSELTGIPAPTLRAWERRYGIPAPSRTKSAYRLYSEHDLEVIKRLRNLIDQGTAPAEAAALIQKAEAALEAVPVAPGEDAFDQARARIVAAVTRFDPTGLEQAIQWATTLGSASAVFSRALGPAMREVGDKWHEGEVSVAQEHLASELLGRTCRQLLRLVQPEDAERMALLACFADETHALPLYGVAFHLVQWGFGTLVLGARTPPEALGHAVKVLEPALVGLSVSVAPAPEAARKLVDAYAKAVGEVPWVVGGAGAEALRRRVEKHGGLLAPPPGEDLEALKPQLERHLAASRRR